MKLMKFRIKNYKSIVDSGDCYFSNKLTILAGKNECGKTTILEALADFQQDILIREEAEPINSTGRPEITVVYKLSAEELNDIYREAGLMFVINNELDFGIYKIYGDKSYFLTAETRKLLGLESLILKAHDKATCLSTIAAKPKYIDQSLASYKIELKTFKSTLVGDGEDMKKVDDVIEAITLYVDREDEVKKIIDSFVASKLPYFILFSSFEDSFPDEIPVAELTTNEWVNDLEVVSSFDKKTIASTNRQAQNNHQRTVNAEFTDKFKNFWTQDEIRLEVVKDGDTVCFWIIEDGVSYKPSQRSKGQQWYLSFFIRIVARINDSKPNVILIDEPGLFLHARAQKDLLNILDNHTSDYPVVFSTHSPYLITEENLENVRLVEKNGRKTTILGKIHAHKTADKETLTPILTAIGLGVNDSITNLNQKNNVVVEGPEDAFYLQAFKLLLPEKERLQINFVNGGGAGKMGIVGAILEGWGANVYYLFDNDQGFKDGSKELDSGWKVLPDLIKKVTPDADSTIADILSITDFKKYVIDNESAKYTIRNSLYAKNNKLDKVLLARQFLQKVKGGLIKVDVDTNRRIKVLFEEIKF